MPNLCYITFNENPDGVYSPGQVISGKVELTTDRIKAVRGIYVTITGSADIFWTEPSRRVDMNGNPMPEIDWYQDHIYYVNSRIDVMCGPDGKVFDLMAGQHEYNFQIDLPTSLPPSFRGVHGSINYAVTCVIDRPKKSDKDHEFVRPFTILPVVDLNLDPAHMRPVEMRDTQTFMKICCCGEDGEILVRGTIPCGGYVPGQNIPVSIFIKNQSKVHFREVNASLVQFVTFSCNVPFGYNSTSIPVSQHLFGPFERYQEKELNCNLTIPVITPSSCNSCRIIEIMYYVAIELDTGIRPTDMKVILPVTIGTIPFHSNGNSEPSFDTTMHNISSTHEATVKLGPILASSTEEGIPASAPREDCTVITTQPVATGGSLQK